MKKSVLIDLVSDIKLGGDESAATKYDSREIEYIIDMVRSQMIDADLKDGISNNNYEIKGDWISTYTDVEVKYDSERDEYYSILPAKLISLFEDRGLKQISPIKGQRNPFIRVANGALGIYSNLEAGYLGGKTGFYTEKHSTEGTRVYYFNLRRQITSVMVKMVASMLDMDSEEDVPIPGNKEADLLNYVSQMLNEKKYTPEDKYNDSSSEVIYKNKA